MGRKSQNNHVCDFISPDCLHYCNLWHCVACVVFMFCELVMLFKKKLKLFVSPQNWQSILRIMILIPKLVFWISYPKSIFGEIWSAKVKAIYFAFKLTHTYAHTHTHTEYLENADSYSEISFLKPISSQLEQSTK